MHKIISKVITVTLMSQQEWNAIVKEFFLFKIQNGRQTDRQTDRQNIG